MTLIPALEWFRERAEKDPILKNEYLKEKEKHAGILGDKTVGELANEFVRALRKFYYKNNEWCKTSIYSEIN